MLRELAALKQLSMHNPSALCADRLNALFKFLEQSESLAVDSIERRSAFAVVERLLRFRWQESNFRNVVLDGELLRLRNVFDRGELGAVSFCGRSVWFGGVHASEERNEQAECRRNSLPYFAVRLMINAMSGDLERLRVVADELCKRFDGDLEELTDKLMENDERLLSVMLALLSARDSKNETHDDFPSPILLFGLFLRNVDFDASVVIDWLQSEIIAVSCIFRILKAIACLSSSELALIYERIDRVPQKKFSQPVLLRQCDDGDDAFRFSVKEIHGKLVVDKAIAIGRPTTKLSNATCQAAPPFQSNFENFLASLQSKLERYERRQIFPFSVKPILSVLSKLNMPPI